jgi:hypothetical protein
MLMSGPRETELTRLFPCLHVVRAVGIAIEPRKLLLGVIGIILLAGGFRLFELLPFAPENAATDYSYGDTPGEWLQTAERTSSLRAAKLILHEPFEFGRTLFSESSARLMLAPEVTVLEPALTLFQSGNSITKLAWNITLILWALLVWSIIGGALARMTALQFAKRERISIRQALRFSTRQTFSYLIAPGLPLGGIGVLLLFNVVLALIGSVPVAGGPILGVLWGLVLFISFLMTMMLIGIVAGWPLMIAAISTEDSDGFDGLSRSFGYLVDRPWYTLLLAGVALLAGMVGWFMLNVIMELTVHLATWSVSVGYLGSTELQLPEAASTTFHQPGTRTAAESLIEFWMQLFAGLLAGYGPSFFFCAVTVIYFLVRRSDDGTELGEAAIFLEPKPAPETEAEEATQDEPVEPAEDARKVEAPQDSSSADATESDVDGTQ